MGDHVSRSMLDELAIIVAEARAIASGEQSDTAVATIVQAVHTLRLIVDPGREACARLAYSNGALVDRYAAASAELTLLASDG